MSILAVKDEKEIADGNAGAVIATKKGIGYSLTVGEG